MGRLVNCPADKCNQETRPTLPAIGQYRILLCKLGFLLQEARARLHQEKY